MISIIVPIYNVKAYLNPCIKSIADQSYTDLEIILVDDGSTDGSSEICDEWAKNDARIQVVHKPNGGLSDARNAGLDIANGEYIYFVDADDYIDKDAMRILIDLMQRYDLSLVMSLCTIVDENGIDIDKKNTGDKSTVQFMNEYELWKRAYSTVEATVVWSKLYRADLWKDIRFARGIIHEDVEILHRLLPKTGKMAMVNKPLYNYRRNMGSIMHRKFSEDNLIRCDVLDQQCEYFRQRGWKRLEKRYWEYGCQSWCDGMNMLDRKNPEVEKSLDRIYKVYLKRLNEIEDRAFGLKFSVKKLIFKKFPELYCRLHKLLSIPHKIA